MKYESEFRIKEKEFRPRENYSHQKVVEELANIVKRADLEIEELNKACYNGSCELDKLQERIKDKEMDIFLLTIIAVSFLSYFIITVFG